MGDRERGEKEKKRGGPDHPCHGIYPCAALRRTPRSTVCASSTLSLPTIHRTVSFPSLAACLRTLVPLCRRVPVPSRVRTQVPTAALPRRPRAHGPPQSHNLLSMNRCLLPCPALPRLTLHCPANLVTFHPEIGSQARSLHWLALPYPAMHRLPRFSSLPLRLRL